MAKPIILPEGKYINEVIHSLPHGRINKQYTGIGATTLEINDDSRNSIIVVPTRALAATKAVGGVFYLGSEFQGRNPDNVQNIKNKVESGNGKAKVMAVADSFVEFFKKNEEFILEHFHLVLDEIDSFQSESSYRLILELCIDIYKLFREKDKSMISATLQNFNDQELDNEQLTIIKREDPKPFKMKLYHSTGDMSAEVAYLINERLKKLPDEKILVAFNDKKGINKAAAAIENKYSIGVLCSESSAFDFLPAWRNALQNKKLINHVTFMTSAYFVGVDIEECGLVLVVGDPNADHTIITEAKIQQCIGRLRCEETKAAFLFKTRKGDTKSMRNYTAWVKRVPKRHCRDATAELISTKREKFKNDVEYNNALESIVKKHTFDSADTGTKNLRTLHLYQNEVKINTLASDYLLQQQNAKNTIYRFPLMTYTQLSSNACFEVSGVQELAIKHSKEQVDKYNSIEADIQKDKKKEVLSWVSEYFYLYSLYAAPSCPKSYKDIVDEYSLLAYNAGDSEAYRGILLKKVHDNKEKIKTITNKLYYIDCWFDYELGPKLRKLFSLHPQEDNVVRYEESEVRRKMISISKDINDKVGVTVKTEGNNLSILVKKFYLVKEFYKVEKEGRCKKYRFLRPLTAFDILNSL